jgi:hypothetical protein
MSEPKKVKTESSKPKDEVKAERRKVKGEEIKQPPAANRPAPTELQTDPGSYRDLKLQTEQMEVHHHPRLDHSHKPWKEYVLEGLMIFLAVFMGFIAENIRENYADHQREKEYMHSIVEDIKSDTAQSHKVLLRLNKTKMALDTLLNMLASDEIIENSNKAYNLWSSHLGFADFIYNDRTIEQLKNNGGLRVIRNKAASDSIMKYDQLIRIFYTQANLMNNALSDQVMYGRMFDFIALQKNRNIPVPLTAESRKLLNVAYANRKIWRYAIMGLIERLQRINAEGKQVIIFIKQQYDIE